MLFISTLQQQIAISSASQFQEEVIECEGNELLLTQDINFGNLYFLPLNMSQCSLNGNGHKVQGRYVQKYIIDTLYNSLVQNIAFEFQGLFDDSNGTFNQSSINALIHNVSGSRIEFTQFVIDSVNFNLTSSGQAAGLIDNVEKQSNISNSVFELHQVVIPSSKTFYISLEVERDDDSNTNATINDNVVALDVNISQFNTATFAFVQNTQEYLNDTQSNIFITTVSNNDSIGQQTQTVTFQSQEPVVYFTSTKQVTAQNASGSSVEVNQETDTPIEITEEEQNLPYEFGGFNVYMNYPTNVCNGFVGLDQNSTCTVYNPTTDDNANPEDKGPLYLKIFIPIVCVLAIVIIVLAIVLGCKSKKSSGSKQKKSDKKKQQNDVEMQQNDNVLDQAA